MGSKGSNAVTTNQTQTFTPNPQIAAAGTQALTGAQTAAQAPFQMPVAPVAGFNPQQLQAFAETQNLQGMAQPYFNTGAGYLNQSAQPISASEVANYYNPMASNVTAQMQNIFGEQQAQNTGNLTQTAGGVGSDRIAVGQADMANQQSLAAGQTYAGLYQQALGAAQGQQQMEAGAGFGIGQMGSAAQAAQQNAVNQLLGTGGLQQSLQQAQMNAPYQQQLAQIAYPFQTAQYLAGITGGLAPAMGGTTTGQATTTQAPPSALAQILGLGTAATGALGASGGSGGIGASPYNPFGASPSYGGGNIYSGDAYGGSAANPLPGLDASDYGARGGRIEKKAGGGSAYGNLDQDMYRQEMGSILPQAAAGNPIAMEVQGDLPTFDDGGMVDSVPPIGSIPGGTPGSVSGAPFPGASNPKIGGATPIPAMQMQPGGGHSQLPYGEGIFIQQQHAPQGGSGSGTGSSGTTGSEIAQGMQMAAQLAPMVLGARRGGHIRAEGGAVSPMHMGEGFDDGGDVGWDPNNPNAGFDPNTGKPVVVTGDPNALSGLVSTPTPPMSPGVTTPANASPSPASPTPPPAPPMGGNVPLPPPRPQMQAQARPPIAAPQPQVQPQQAPVAQAPMGGQQISQVQTPYPDATASDWGQDAARSPWMALIKAGAAMAQQTGPIGSVIGKGIEAGSNELEGQRKSLDNEEQINLKAQQLHDEAQRHLDQYNRLTPYQREEMGYKGQELDLQRQRLDLMKDRYQNVSPSVLRQVQKDVYSDPIWGARSQDEQDAEVERRVSMIGAGRGGQGAPTAAPAGGEGDTPVGSTKQFKQGMGRKIKAGPDSDPTTWAPG